MAPRAPRARSLWGLALLVCQACGPANLAAFDVTANANAVASPNAIIDVDGHEGLSFVASSPSGMCLMPQGGVDAAAGASVGVAPCAQGPGQAWIVADDGTLTLANGLTLKVTNVKNGAFIVMPSASGNAQVTPTLAALDVHLTFVGGHMVLADTIKGTQATVMATSAAASGGNFVPVRALPITLSGSDPTTTWSVGHAYLGTGGGLILDGFAIRLREAPTLCLTGARSVVGVEPCQGASTQAWTLNAAGTPQLGSYCLGVNTSGPIAQGAGAVFAVCNVQDSRQQWSFAAGQMALANFFLAPQSLPAPTHGFTRAALSASATLWHLGQ